MIKGERRLVLVNLRLHALGSTVDPSREASAAGQMVNVAIWWLVHYPFTQNGLCYLRFKRTNGQGLVWSLDALLFFFYFSVPLKPEDLFQIMCTSHRRPSSTAGHGQRANSPPRRRRHIYSRHFITSVRSTVFALCVQSPTISPNKLLVG